MKGKGGADEAPAEWRPEVVGEGAREGRWWCWGAGWERKVGGGREILIRLGGEEAEAAAIPSNWPALGTKEGRGGVMVLVMRVE